MPAPATWVNLNVCKSLEEFGWQRFSRLLTFNPYSLVCQNPNSASLHVCFFFFSCLPANSKDIQHKYIYQYTSHWWFLFDSAFATVTIIMVTTLKETYTWKRSSEEADFYMFWGSPRIFVSFFLQRFLLSVFNSKRLFCSEICAPLNWCTLSQVCQARSLECGKLQRLGSGRSCWWDQSLCLLQGSVVSEGISPDRLSRNLSYVSSQLCSFQNAD